MIKQSLFALIFVFGLFLFGCSSGLREASGSLPVSPGTPEQASENAGVESGTPSSPPPFTGAVIAEVPPLPEPPVQERSSPY